MFGSPQDIPQELQGKEVIFKFQSPLTESEEEQKVQLFSQVADMIAKASQFDQGVALHVDFGEALRDSIAGIGAPAKWLNEVADVKKKKDALEEQQAVMAQEAMAADQEGAGAAAA